MSTSQELGGKCFLSLLSSGGGSLINCMPLCTITKKPSDEVVHSEENSWLLKKILSGEGDGTKGINGAKKKGKSYIPNLGVFTADLMNTL